MFRFIPLLMKYQKFRYKASVVKPNEGWIWDRFYNPLDYLDETHVTQEIKDYYDKAIKYQLKAFGATRFVNKNPRNCLRLRWINALYPNAYHIVIWRQPQPAINSMYNSFKKQEKKWGEKLYQKPKKITHNYYRGYGYIKEILGNKASKLQTCINYFSLMSKSLKNDLEIVKDRLIEIHYEDFINSPQETMKKLYDFTELDWYDQLSKKIPKKLELKNNEKWKQLPQEESSMLENLEEFIP